MNGVSGKGPSVRTRQSLDDFAAVTGALSDPHRIRALMALRSGERCVCQIIELLGLAPSTVSKHMTILRQAGLVESRKDSRWVYYRLPDAGSRESAAGALIDAAADMLINDDRIVQDGVSMNAIIAEGLEAICKRQRGCCGLPDIPKKLFKRRNNG
jgi:ArsR family transcriptional regulator